MSDLKHSPQAPPGIYTSLDDLIRLQHRATGFSFLPRQPVHSLLSGRHASRMRGRGLNFEEIRDYLPGDDVRTMDWKVTARTGRPHVRVYTEERDRPAILVVDQRMGMFFGSRVNMKSVTAAEAAALGAWRVFDSGDRIGAVVFNDTEVVQVKPHRSRSAVMRILGAIVKMNNALNAQTQAEPNHGMLGEVLKKVDQIAGHDYLVAIISDFDGDEKEIRRSVTRLAHNNDVLAVPVYDPLAMDLPDRGRLVVSDGELQVDVPMGASKMRKSIAEFTDRRLTEILSWQKDLGVPVLPLTTDKEVTQQVRNLLGRREGR